MAKKRSCSTFAEEGKNTYSISMCEIKDPRKATHCKHSFCTTCLDRWMQTKFSCGQLATCPLCRSALHYEFLQEGNVSDEQQYVNLMEGDFVHEENALDSAWIGYGPEEDAREPASHLQNAPLKVEEFHHLHPNALRPPRGPRRGCNVRTSRTYNG